MLQPLAERVASADSIYEQLVERDLLLSSRKEAIIDCHIILQNYKLKQKIDRINEKYVEQQLQDTIYYNLRADLDESFKVQIDYKSQRGQRFPQRPITLSSSYISTTSHAFGQ